MLELTDIEAGYGRTRVLHGVTVPAGKVVAVLGHNGAGKTTLLRVAIGLIKPSKGRVLFDGEDIASLAPNKRVARGMAYVPQGQQAFGQLTTLENLQLVADGRRGGKALIDAQMARFPALETFAARKAGLLSGGQRQQLAIARALITEPKLLILDEPTRGIDVGAKAEIQKLVVSLSEEGMAVVYISAELEEVLRLSHTMGVLRDRRLVARMANGPDVTAGRVLEIIASGEHQ
jgi:urea transport system ATP-binding protein